MQTTTLQVQANSGTTATQNKPNINTNAPDNDFQRTLNRQIEQRQAASARQAQTQAQNQAQAKAGALGQDPVQAQSDAQVQARTVKPQPSRPAPTAPAPAQNTQVEQDGQADAAKAADATTAASQPAATNKSEATDEGEDKLADSDTTAEETSPMSQMLALIASLNQRTGAGKADAADGPDLGELDDPSAGSGKSGGASFGAAFGATRAASAAAAKLKAAPGETAEADESHDLHAVAGGAGGQGKPDADAGKLGTLKAGDTFQQIQTAANDALQSQAVPTAPQVSTTAQLSATVAQAATSVPTDKLNGRVGSPAWDQELGQKVVWMVAGGEQSASLTLNPPDLGPLQVVLNVTNDQATAAFTSAAPEVRQALEAAMPQLKDMLSDAGIQLGNATVSAGNPQQQQDGGRRDSGLASGRRGSDGNTDDIAARTSTVAVRRTPLGKVDTFA
jgi:flagellar hook-length control protein FliK